MADPGPKVSQLPELDEPGDTDLIYIARSGIGQYKQYLRDITGWASYYIEASEADQGDTGDGKSIKAYADTVGTTKNCIFRFIRGSGDTTDYTVTTNIDLSTYTNITFEFERGAELTGAGDIIFPSPSNIIAQPNQLIFSGAGTVSFAEPGEIYPQWFGAIFDGVTDDASAWQAALNSLPADGGTIRHIGGTSVVNGELLWPNDGTETRPISIVGISSRARHAGVGNDYSSTSRIYHTDTTGSLFDCRNGDDSNVNFNGRLENLYLIGAGDTNDTNGILIYTMKNATIRNVAIAEFGDGVDLNGYAYYSTIEDCVFNYNNIGFKGTIAGFNGTKFQRCHFSKNTAEGFKGTYGGYPGGDFDGCWFEDNGSYGISATNAVTISIINSYFESNDGAAEVLISGDGFYNSTVNVIGTNFEPSATANSLYLSGIANLNIIGSRLYAYRSSRCVWIIGNTIPRGTLLGNKWNRTAGVAPMAPAYYGNFISSDAEKASISNGYGNQYKYVNNYGDILFTDDPHIAGSRVGLIIKEPGGGGSVSIAGVTGTTTNGSATVTVNSTAKLYRSMAIQIDNGGNPLTWGSAAYDYAVILTVDSATQITVDNTADANVVGGALTLNLASFYAIYGIQLYRSVSVAAAIATSGTGEDDLHSFAIPAGSMTTIGGIRLLAAGTKSGAAGNKTIKLHFGATSWTVHAAANNANDWRLEAEIYNSGAAATQAITWKCWDGTTITQGFETAAIDTATATTIKVTGECADAGDTITETIFVLDAI